MKRVITIVGGGQSGLQLGNGLLAAGYDVRLVQDRKGDDIRAGKVMSSQCMFDKALSYERELGLNFWDKECPTVDSISFTVPAPDGSGNKAIDWNGLLDKPAQAVDQRLTHGAYRQAGSLAQVLEQFRMRRRPPVESQPGADDHDGIDALPRQILGRRHNAVPGRLVALGRERAHAHPAWQKAHAGIHDWTFERDIVRRKRNDQADGDVAGHRREARRLRAAR